MGKKHAGPIVIAARLFHMRSNNLPKGIRRRHNGCQDYWGAGVVPGWLAAWQESGESEIKWLLQTAGRTG